MRVHSLVAWAAAAALAGNAGAEGLGFVYVTANTGLSSGGHAALVADGNVYHLQDSEEGILLLERVTWPAFHEVYAGLYNRPLVVARVDAPPGVTGKVERAFSRLYVEQELALADRDSLRDDVAWLDASGAGRPAPPLRGLGLLDPARPGDPDALRLRTAAGPVDGVLAESERRVAELSQSPDPARLESLREALTLREAARALDRGSALAPEAVAALPAEIDTPLSPAEREGLEAFSARLETAAAELLRSNRPDRGYALVLAQARYVAARRSLSTNRLVLLDAFSGAENAPGGDASDSVRAKRREQAAELVRRGRDEVLAKSRIEESNWNLLEEVAAIAARDGRSDAGGMLSELGLRKLPARARSADAPRLGGDVPHALERARARLRDADAALQARWGYDLVHHNCITELGRTTDTAFATPEEAVLALGAVANPDDQAFAFVPFLFFDRVRHRMRVTQVGYFESHREKELAKLLEESPGLATRARESVAYTSTIYTPRPRDSAFLLFTDDVFWRRPLYGSVNLLFGLGYTAYGVGALPFDRGERAMAGLDGMLWSFPELAFVNVRKGTFDWAD